MSRRKEPKRVFTKLERFLYRTFLLITIFLVVGIIFGQVSLSKINLEVQKLSLEVSKQQETNQSLTMKINEMSSLENIRSVSENLGLAYNNDNIKTIE